MPILNPLPNNPILITLKGQFTKHWPFFLGLAVSFFLFSLAVTQLDFSFYPGDLIDARFNLYLLEHNFQWLSGNINSYWNAPFMFPETKVLSFSDNLMGSSLVYTAFRIGHISPETSFQLWFVFIQGLNYLAAYWFLQKVFNDSWAAACGALLFCCSLGLQSQMAHAQVFARFPIPLMLGYLYLFNQSHRLKHLYAALLFWVWQWYCGIYLGFLSLMVFVLGFALSFFNKGYSVFKSNSRWYKIGLLCLPLVGLLAVLPLAIPYLQRARQVSMHAYPLVADSIPTLWSYFSSWKGSLFWDVLFGWYTHVPAYWDHMIFPGMMAWGGIAFWMFRALKNPRKSNLFLLLIFLGLFVSVLRLGDYSIYKLWYQIPGFASMKSLGRIINVHLIFFGAGLAYALQTLNQRFPQKRTLMGILCMLFLVLDNYVQPDNIHRREKHLSLQRINKICFELQKYPLAKIFSYEPLHPEGLGADYQLDAMLAAQRTGKTCINGYSATSPGAFTPYWTLPNEANRNYWLKASGVKIPNLIVLH